MGPKVLLLAMRRQPTPLSSKAKECTSTVVAAPSSPTLNVAEAADSFESPIFTLTFLSGALALPKLIRIMTPLRRRFTRMISKGRICVAKRDWIVRLRPPMKRRSQSMRFPDWINAPEVVSRLR